MGLFDKEWAEKRGSWMKAVTREMGRETLGR